MFAYTFSDTEEEKTGVAIIVYALLINIFFPSSLEVVTVWLCDLFIGENHANEPISGRP